MMTPNELRQHLGLRTLPADDNSNGRMLLAALGSVSALIGEDKIEGHASWHDDMMSDGDESDGVHIRVIVASGVIALDYDFSFDGYPDAKFVPWSRIRALRVIAEPGRQTVIANAWIETEDTDIELAGARKDLFAELVRAVRRNLR